MLEAVIFDMDGVLFDTEQICLDAWQTVAIKHNLGDITSACINCIGVNREKGKEIFKSTVSKDFPYDKMRDEVSVLCHETIDKNGIPLKSGVKEILSFIKSKGLKFRENKQGSFSKQNVVFCVIIHKMLQRKW